VTDSPLHQELNVVAIVAILEGHGVEYIVVGGYAATLHGELDLTFTPSGTQGYPDLHRHASPFCIGTVYVQVASLSDVIRSKTAAGRTKDLEALPELRRLEAADHT